MLVEETIYPEKSRYLLIWIILEHIFRKQYSCWARLVTASHHLEGITFWKLSTVLHVEEGGHTANKASDWGFFKQYFLDSKKRWRKPACGELMIPKLVHSISAFQNGRLAFASANYYRRWITPANWIRRMFTFQFHCISHQGTMSGFMVGESFQFFCLCLGFGQYLGDILIIDILQINAYILTSRGTAIFLLQKFGFLGEFNIRPAEVLSKKNS